MHVPVEMTNVTTPTNVKTFHHLLAILTFVVGLATTNFKNADKYWHVLTFVDVLTFVVLTVPKVENG